MVKAAILHEGNDKDNTDKKLLKSLLLDLGLNADDIHFEGFGNKSNFFNVQNPKYLRLKNFVSTGQIDKLLFIVDADNEKDDTQYKGFENTEKALKQIINHLEFEDVADFYIVCDPLSKTGYLESLILSSLPEEKQNCIRSFINCSGSNPKLDDKRIINHLYTIAYPDPPYNFEHKNFDDLKSALKKLFP